MILFIVLALAQAFVTSVGWLVVVRLFLGIPLGSDISNGYTYIMESMPKGEREVMGNRWQFMFAIGEVLTLAVIAIFLIVDMPHEMDLARDAGPRRGAGADHPVMRHDLPETAVWLIRHGRFREAKQVAHQMYRRPAGHAAGPGRRRAESRARPPSSPTSARTRSAGARRSMAGSPALPRAANSRPSPSTCRCCS